jgi:hypothetical protein
MSFLNQKSQEPYILLLWALWYPRVLSIKKNNKIGAENQMLG